MSRIDNYREKTSNLPALSTIREEAGCQPGEHNYGAVTFSDGPMLATEDGTRIVLFVCSKCGQERVVNLTALGLPVLKWG